MTRHCIHQTGIAFILGLQLLLPGTSIGQAHEDALVATTPHFAFYSDFATNLNDALIAADVAKSELFWTGAAKACFDGLPPSARAGWDRATDYYAEIISPAGAFDRQQLLLRAYLAGFEDELGGWNDEKLVDSSAAQFVDIASSFRSAAAPAYEACYWSTQDAENRQWIDDLRSQLATYETKVATRLQDLYQTSWDGLPVRVDVVETVSWSGANTVFRDSGGHILVSNADEGHAALELVFHEASHLLMGRDAPVRNALDEAASSLDEPLPRNLWHVVLFYTTGETVRQILDDAGASDYTPMLNGIFERGTWQNFRDAVESAWLDYLHGEYSLSEAAVNLVRMINESK